MDAQQAGAANAPKLSPNHTAPRLSGILRVIRIFPNRDSAVRLIGAVMMEINESWSNGRHCLDMDEYLRWRGEQEISSHGTH